MPLTAPPGLLGVRAAIGHLVTTLYIDREPYENIQPIQGIRVWAESTTKLPALQTQWRKIDPYTKFPHLAPEADFQSVKDVLERLLLSMQPFGRMSPDECCFYEVVFTITLSLLRFGCYHQTNGAADLPAMAQIFETLIGVLDTVGEAEFEYNDHTRATLNAKLSVCMVCEFIFDCRVEHRMCVAFNTYQNIMSTEMPLSKHNMIRNYVLEPESFAQLELRNLEQELFEKPIISTKCASVSAENVDSIPDFVQILVNLTQYDFLPLAATAFSLMYRCVAPL